MYPTGADADGETHPAKTCRAEGLWFAKDPDGSWSISLTPTPRD